MAATVEAELGNLETDLVEKPSADIAAVAENGISRPFPTEQRRRQTRSQVLYLADDVAGIESCQLSEVSSPVLLLADGLEPVAWCQLADNGKSTLSNSSIVHQRACLRAPALRRLMAPAINTRDRAR